MVTLHSGWPPHSGRVIFPTIVVVLLLATGGGPSSPLPSASPPTAPHTTPGGLLAQTRAPPPLLPSPGHGTWNWINASSLYPAAPPIRVLGSLSEDPANNASILYGGVDYSGTFLNDSWNYTGLGGWTVQNPTGGPQLGRFGQMMAYDANATVKSVVMYGGCTTGNGCPYNRYWTYGPGKVWGAGLSPAGGLMQGGLAYYPPGGYLLLFGGCAVFNLGSRTCTTLSQATWKYSGGTSWTQLFGPSQPSPRDGFGMAYDPALREIVLYGGRSSTGMLQDTWTYSQGIWTNVTSSLSGTGPGPRDDMVMTWDNQSRSLVLFGGLTASNAPLGDTWTFNGTAWVSLLTKDSPSPRFGAMSAQIGYGNIVLFGGGAATTLDDTWILDGPLDSSLALSRSTIDIGESTNLSATGTGGVLPYTWSYHGLPAGCSSANSPTLSCKPTNTGTYLLNVTGVDRLGLSNTSVNVSLTVNSAPSVTAFTASPATLPPGGTTYLNTTTAGGTPPYSYSYSGLPGGCTTANLSSLSCTPSGPGTFTVTVTVSDRTGTVAQARTSFTEGATPPLAISAFTISPAALTLGGTTYLNVTATGGTPPYTYAYAGLPTGCSSANTATLTCVPATKGYFPVTATVTDSATRTAGAQATLVVTAPLVVNSFTVSPSTLALGGTTYLNVSATGGTPPYAYSYGGLPPGCSSGSVANLTCVPGSAGSFSVSVTVKDTGGRSDTGGPLNLTVTSPSGYPSISSFTASPSPIPFGGNTYFNVTATGGTTPYTYSYSGLPPGCAGNNAPSILCTPSAVGSFPVTALVTDSVGHTVSATTSLTVTSTLAIAAFTVSPSTIPLGGTTYLNVTATGGSPPYAYRYSGLPAGCASSSTPALVCVPGAAGTYSVTVQVTDTMANQVTSSPVTFSVSAPGGPSLTSFTALPSSLYVGDTLYLNTTATGGTAPYSYVYHYLPGGCFSSSTPTYTCTPSSPGTYASISVTVTDSGGRSATSQPATVTVIPLPSITAFTVQPATIPFGGTAYANVSATGGVAPYTYAFSGLPSGCTSANTARLVCVPTASGTFHLTATVTDANGRTATSGSAPLTVNPAPSPTITAFTALPGTLYVGSTLYVNTTATGGTPPYTYAFTGLPTGCTSSSTATYTCQPTTPGTYPSLTVTVTDSRSMGATSSPLSVTVLSLPAISTFTVLPSSIPLGGTAYLNVTVSGGAPPYTYAFSGLPPNCTSASTPSLPCVPSVTGTFSVTVTATDANGRSVSSSPATLTVNLPPPTINSYGASPSTFYVGGTTYLNVTATGGTAPLAYTYANLPSGCTSQDTPTLTCTPASAGTYSGIIVTVTDANRYSVTSQPLNLTVNSFPSISAFTASPGVIPLGGTTYLNVTPTGGVLPYTFSYANLPTGCLNANVSSLSCSPSAAGTYRAITATLTDRFGQRATSAPLTVTVSTTGRPLAILSFTVSPATLAANSTTYLNVSATGGTPPYTYLYAGLPPGCASSSAAQIFCSPSMAGSYNLTVTVSDSGGGSVTSAPEPLRVTPGIPLPSIASFTASPGHLAIGGTTYLNVSVNGGAPPYSYSYLQLPPGCASADTAHLLCVPASLGTFYPVVRVTDQVNHEASSTTSLTVTGTAVPPIISAFTASQDPDPVNHVTYLQVVATGGNPPYTYAYSGLPAGCASNDTAALTCTPSSTGTYTVKVTLTDAVGLTASATLTLTVSAPATSGLVGSLGGWALVALAIGILALLALLVLVARRRRRAPTAQAPAGTGPWPAASALPTTAAAVAPLPAAGAAAPASEWDESDEAVTSGPDEAAIRPGLPPGQEDWSEESDVSPGPGGP